MNRKHAPAKLSMCILLSLYGGQALAAEIATLPETQAETEKVQAGINIERQQIANTPVGNTDLSSLLQRQSGIGVDNGISGMRGGDLAPEAISIAGARPHETQYMIGGVSTNNITTAGTHENSGALGSGHTSGYFVDTALMESVEVLERNISPEYGGFTGGIVNVELRKPTNEFQLEYNYRMTDSDWNAKPETSAKDKGFDDGAYGDGRYQPNYQKRFHSLHLSGAISEHQKLAVNLSRKDSEIPLNNGGEVKDYGQSIDNLFLTHFLEWGRWQLQSDLRYSSFSSKAFRNDALNNDAAQAESDSTSEHQGLGATFKLEGVFDWGTWNTSLAFDQLEDSRTSEVDYLRINIISGENFKRENIGGLGNLSQTQDTWQLKSTLELAPLYLGQTRHDLMLGAEFVSQQAMQQRNKDFSAFQYSEKSSDNKSIVNWNLYEAGRVEVDSRRIALFASDTVAWDKLTLNLGGRLEHLEAFDDTVFSPRLSASWDFDTEFTNRVTLGTSRYYASEQLSWALRNEARILHTQYKKCTSATGDYSSNQLADYQCLSSNPSQVLDLNTAEVPYANEYSVNWDLELGNWGINSGYLMRQQRKGLSMVKDRIANEIKSDSHILSLDIHNLERFNFVGGKLSTYLNLSYEDRKASGNFSPKYDAVNDLSNAYEEEWVIYNGQLIKSSEMDTSGLSSPWEARLGADIEWDSLGLTWSNLLNYEDGRNLSQLVGYQRVEIDGQTTLAKAINSAKMDSLITWDTSLRWSPEALVKHHASIELSVTNLLDSHAQISTHGSNINGRDMSFNYFNKGREVWLSLTIRN